LQPALQLITRVLEAGPKVYAALKDLRTRQSWMRSPPLGKDQEEYNDITRMVPVEEIDLSKCYAPVKTLDKMGWNSVAEIERIMLERVQIRIGSVYLDDDAEEGVPYYMNWGSTIPVERETYIAITIGAEMLWPLLVPEYSASEKMAASFGIAVSLLHEFAVCVKSLNEIFPINI
jgi:hypothetical protein